MCFTVVCPLSSVAYGSQNQTGLVYEQKIQFVQGRAMFYPGETLLVPEFSQNCDVLDPRDLLKKKKNPDTQAHGVELVVG